MAVKDEMPARIESIKKRLRQQSCGGSHLADGTPVGDALGDTARLLDDLYLLLSRPITMQIVCRGGDGGGAGQPPNSAHFNVGTPGGGGTSSNERGTVTIIKK